MLGIVNFAAQQESRILIWVYLMFLAAVLENVGVFMKLVTYNLERQLNIYICNTSAECGPNCTRNVTALFLKVTVYLRLSLNCIYGAVLLMECCWDCAITMD